MNEPTKAIQYIIDTAPLYAKAKADRMYLDEYRRSKHAQLKSLAGTEVLGKQDTFAYVLRTLLKEILTITQPLSEQGDKHE
jgi:hypothetical protein